MFYFLLKLLMLGNFSYGFWVLTVFRITILGAAQCWGETVQLSVSVLFSWGNSLWNFYQCGNFGRLFPRSYDNGHFCCRLKQIYNEQVGDLLDPTQRNLEVSIRLPLWYSFVIKTLCASTFVFIAACLLWFGPNCHRWRMTPKIHCP
jgi:hypothetical protein